MCKTRFDHGGVLGVFALTYVVRKEGGGNALFWLPSSYL